MTTPELIPGPRLSSAAWPALCVTGKELGVPIVDASYAYSRIDRGSRIQCLLKNVVRFD